MIRPPWFKRHGSEFIGPPRVREMHARRTLTPLRVRLWAALRSCYAHPSASAARASVDACVCACGRTRLRAAVRLRQHLLRACATVLCACACVCAPARLARLPASRRECERTAARVSRHASVQLRGRRNAYAHTRAQATRTRMHVRGRTHARAPTHAHPRASTHGRIRAHTRKRARTSADTRMRPSASPACG
eukprot:5947428-Pleurochrysis_carterae.AAC.2